MTVYAVTREIDRLAAVGRRRRDPDRATLADSGLDLTLTHDQAQDLYTWDENYLIAVRSMVRGLEHYRKNAFAPA